MTTATALRPSAPTPNAASAGTAAPGPLARAAGGVFVVGSLIHLFGVMFERLPPATSLALLGPAVGYLLLVPGASLLRARVSLPFLLLVGWMTASLIWTANPERTVLLLWTQVPLLVALAVLAGTLPAATLQSALRWTVRLAVVVVVLALVTDPSSRTSGDTQFEVEGWRGSFPDKNSMALFLVFGFAVTLILDRGLPRLLTGAAIAGVLAGSQSVTGMSGAVLVVLLWLWLLLFRRRRVDARRFVLASVALALSAVVAIAGNYANLLGAAGRDATLTGRTDIWGASIRMIQKSPEVGYGLGGMISISPPSQVTLDLWRDIGFQAVHAHNGVLDLLGQIGVVGLVLYVACMVSLVALALRQIMDSPVALLSVVTVGVQLLISFTENVLLGPWLAVLVVLQAALLHQQAEAERPGVGVKSELR